ncbi:hypothetical protein COT94_01020 [Candidatus Falkowbacteria bacterium CG10_big_fil_rev_8_21_14_0_10_37_14]|uniref:DUF3494 domain-containing protein n=1 Tax=Candidatus Falkowbacteria bacterium CG10_big_fil_rev_8_21_14_0_10_37_14 TaxID=1974561 RepID=A0A2M6WTZ0_9BACT|nr:MAG: hypothetical protein COT94_01020 [Candidatus Falkowbacteria bacterium CG10_big_fil_rev_8_21_14_0_10_37_14]
MKKINKKSLASLVMISLFLGLVGPTSVLALSPVSTPPLGVAASFGVLADTFTPIIATTSISGDLGYTTLSSSGFHTLTGSTYIADSVYQEAGTDQNSALAILNNQGPCTSLGANVVLAGTYTPGCYTSSGSMDIALGTTVTLSGAGTFLFRPGGALTTGANAIVISTAGASACDIFWTPGAATTLGANTAFLGTVIDASGITIGDTVNWMVGL